MNMRLFKEKQVVALADAWSAVASTARRGSLTKSFFDRMMGEEAVGRMIGGRMIGGKMIIVGVISGLDVECSKSGVGKSKLNVECSMPDDQDCCTPLRDTLHLWKISRQARQGRQARKKTMDTGGRDFFWSAVASEAPHRFGALWIFSARITGCGSRRLATRPGGFPRSHPCPRSKAAMRFACRRSPKFPQSKTHNSSLQSFCHQ